MTRCLPALLLSCGLPLTASGQSLDACRRITDQAERLNCYDKLATPAAEAHDAPRQAPPASQAAPAGTLKVPAASSSLLGQAWELDAGERRHILRIRPYKPVYILPGFHTSHTNPFPNSPAIGHTSEGTGQSSDEAKLQISLKTKLAEDIFGANGDLWFGFTQTSRWQVYNASTSRPFRETNYEPEAMLIWRTDYSLGGWRARYLSLGINHQSNGRSLPLSRSWNRVIAGIALEKDDWTLTFRPWWRIPEASTQDDNPDISNYLGRADLQAVKSWNQQQFSILLRHSLRGGSNSHGGLQVDYAFPLAGELRGHLQWFSGYGESMIDYNHRANYYGIGVSLLEWY